MAARPTLDSMMVMLGFQDLRSVLGVGEVEWS